MNNRAYNFVRQSLTMICVMLISSWSVSAQSYNLTLEECRQMAIKNSHAMKSSAERESISEDMLSAYKSNNLPNFSLSGNYLYSSSVATMTMTGGYLPTYSPDATTGVLTPNISGVTADGEYIFSSYAYMPDQNFDLKIGSVYNFGVMATQPIYMGGKISNAIKMARLGVDVSKVESRRSEADVIAQTDLAFYNVLKVEEMLLSAKKYESVVEEFHRQMESGVKVGMKRRNDLQKVAVKLSEAELLRVKAENGLRLAKMNLCYAVGLPLTTSDISLSDVTVASTAVSDQDLDVSGRPEYELLEHQLEAKRLEVEISRSEFLPSVSAVASYSYMNGISLNGARLFNDPNVVAGVTANIPIFHWGEGRKKISAKRREVTIAQSEMEDLTRLMSLELLQAINSYNESIYEVELTERSVAQAQENMRMSRSHYEAGMETIADYLESQALWQQAMSDLCSARAEMRVAYSRYERCR